MTTTSQLDCTPLIGMEIHVQLATRSKMFCRCRVAFGAEPNSLVCPVCLGLPGALPVINHHALQLALKMSLALGCRIAPFTKWDRKSYYYPDLPKNYQISQYDLPLAADGCFEFELDGGVRRVGIIRAHLEEDAGKNVHDDAEVTRVDLNRAGTPLLEIVTRPELHGAEEAYAFCMQLQRLATHLGVSEASMQKGQMRFEPNINLVIRTGGGTVATPICEVKNLNSFRSVRSAVAYEIERHARTWLQDPTYTREQRSKENLGWDDVREETVFQRGKEEAHDYRYFPDPDLVPVELAVEDVDAVRETLPELPLARKSRLMRDAGFSSRDAWQIIEDRASAELFDAAVAAGADAATLGKQFLSFWSKLANVRGCRIAGLGVDAARIGELAALTAQGRINATAAARLAQIMLDGPESVETLARVHGLEQLQDIAALEALVDEAIRAHPKAAEEVTSRGKKWQKSVGFLQGQVMRASGGAAAPEVVRDILERRFGIEAEDA